MELEPQARALSLKPGPPSGHAEVLTGESSEDNVDGSPAVTSCVARTSPVLSAPVSVFATSDSAQLSSSVSECARRLLRKATIGAASPRPVRPACALRLFTTGLGAPRPLRATRVSKLTASVSLEGSGDGGGGDEVDIGDSLHVRPAVAQHAQARRIDLRLQDRFNAAALKAVVHATDAGEQRDAEQR